MTSGLELTEPPKPSSPRSPKRSMMFVMLGGVLAIVGTLAAGYYFAMRPVTLRIAVGPAGSDDLRVVQALTQAFAQTHSHIRLRPIQTDGAAASAETLAEGKADLAIIRGDLHVPKMAQAVATLRKNVAVLWVPPAMKGKKAAPKITKIAQLSGRRVGVVGRTQANVDLLKVILQQYGVDPNKVEIVQFPTTEAADAIRSQKADAYLAAGPVNSKITADAIAASTRDGRKPTFLAIDSAEAIAQNHPMYEASEIPAGVFGGSPAARPEEEVKTISFSHHIVARKDLSEPTIAAFTRQLFAIRQTVMAEFPLAAKIETPDTDKDAAIPVHPGAAAFVDGEEKSFLDRYSDFIWWGLMGLSAMGSAGAWFAGYLKKDERGDNSSLRERLLEMIGAARRSDSAEELDKMQAEADDILRDTLVCFEHGAIEEGALTAFNIALEQFHHAVADRKALLMNMPQNLQRASAQLRATGTL
jgi:TRAP transporter TAXI family solute receptor